MDTRVLLNNGEHVGFVKDDGTFSMYAALRTAGGEREALNALRRWQAAADGWGGAGGQSERAHRVLRRGCDRERLRL